MMILDIPTGRLQWVDAGHPAPFLIRDRAVVDRLQSPTTLPITSPPSTEPADDAPAPSPKPAAGPWFVPDVTQDGIGASAYVAAVSVMKSRLLSGVRACAWRWSYITL
ncbi:protein phosphatase 2C domain protein [Actinobacteria bacterium OV320]|nr:protein phosphatase 2C domain protein [Actinobacteria bacterium OV320]